MPTISGASAKRLAKELQDLSKPGNLPDGCRVWLKNESDLQNWQAELIGPEGSPYEGYKFLFAITLPHNYPFAPPAVKALTKVYHCNFNATGGICIDILKSNWSPALSVTKVMLSILSLLTDPNPGDPLVPEIAQLYKKDRRAHDANAKDWARRYADKVELTPAEAEAKPVPKPAPKPAPPKKAPIVIDLD